MNNQEAVALPEQELASFREEAYADLIRRIPAGSLDYERDTSGPPKSSERRSRLSGRSLARREKAGTGMGTEEYLAFLEAHQPMPGDDVITEAEGNTFDQALKHFEAHPDPRCVPLLINAVSKSTGLGMYEHIKFTLLAHPRDLVLPHLQKALRSTNAGVVYRCCWWCGDFDAAELAADVQAVLTHPDEDVQIAAAAFLG
jgi:hypothetical protein